MATQNKQFIFNSEQCVLIRRQFNEYITDTSYNAEDLLNDEKTLKHFVSTLETHLGSKDFNVGLTTSEGELLTWLLSMNDYSIHFLNSMKTLIKTFK